jgi:Cd2+/Zn2+-exporting ATPase
VLIKGGEHLEALGGIRALAIDKTGTLTQGRLKVSGFQADGADTADHDRLLHQIVSLEARSEHPVAEAIVRFGAERGVRPDGIVEEFASEPGRGVRGRIGGIEVVVGTEELVGEVNARDGADAKSGTLRIYAVTGDGRRGTMTLRDEIRMEAAPVVRRLHDLGISPIVMLTGDSAEAGQAVGRAAGVDAVQSRLLPEEKVRAVQELRVRHGLVGMLGDGVNDAPALAAASVGLAMGAAGSPATIETADVALMADDLTKLPYAIHLARSARRTVRFNIGLALGTKLLLAVGAVLGLVSLAVAVLVGDMGASLVVTANALRLARIRPEPVDDRVARVRLKGITDEDSH